MNPWIAIQDFLEQLDSGSATPVALFAVGPV